MKIHGRRFDSELIRELGRFTILWNMFERAICGCNCSAASILTAAPGLRICPDRMDELQSVLNDRRDLFDLSVQAYVDGGLHPENARSSGKPILRHMEDFLNGEEQNREVGCLLVIYRIRNNLMHGLKLAEELNLQIDVFRAVNGVLESIDDSRYQFV